MGPAAYLEILYGEPDGVTLPETGSDWSVRLADDVMSGRQDVGQFSKLSPRALAGFGHSFT